MFFPINLLLSSGCSCLGDQERINEGVDSIRRKTELSYAKPLSISTTERGSGIRGGTLTAPGLFKEVGNCVMPKQGVFCRVLNTGKIKPNDRIVYFPYEWNNENDGSYVVHVAWDRQVLALAWPRHLFSGDMTG